MGIVTSRAGTVITNLVTNLKANATFADPVRVYDGPTTAGDTMWTQAVFVGFDGDWHETATGTVGNATAYEAVLINQERPYVGGTTFGTSVKETLEVRCCAEAWSGDVGIPGIRGQVLTLLAGVETVIRTDPTFGIDGSTIAELQVGSLTYVFDASGNVGCRVAFTVHVVTFLLTT